MAQKKIFNEENVGEFYLKFFFFFRNKFISASSRRFKNSLTFDLCSVNLEQVADKTENKNKKKF